MNADQREALVKEARSLIDKKDHIRDPNRGDEISIKIMQIYAQIDKLDQQKGTK